MKAEAHIPTNTAHLIDHKITYMSLLCKVHGLFWSSLLSSYYTKMKMRLFIKILNSTAYVSCINIFLLGLVSQLFG